MLSLAISTLLMAMAQVGTGLAPGSDREALVHSLDVLDWIGKPVNNSRWEQVARVERVLFDPRSGRATFVVLSFVGREDMVAIPWSGISVDSLGRARLVAEERALRESLTFHGARPVDRREASMAQDPLPEETVARGTDPGFRIESGGDAILQGIIVGRMSLPAMSGEQRAKALLDVGTETVRIDLGPEEALEKWEREVGPGDRVQILARRAELGGAEEFVASEVRVRGSTFVVRRNDGR